MWGKLRSIFSGRFILRVIRIMNREKFGGYMKKLVLGFLFVLLSGAAFSMQGNDLLIDFINTPVEEVEKNFTEAELDDIEKTMMEMNTKKNYCCRGTRGPSMRCATPMRFRCKRKPNCYWNC